MLTMSGLQRSLSCDGSLVLAKARNANPWAALGNEEHEDLSDLGSLPPNLKKHVPPNARSEVKIAYDAATGAGRIIGEGSGRSYGVLGPFEIGGSLDVVGVDGDCVIVLDWKTGFNAVEPARTNAQLWGYALAVCRALGLSRAIVRIVYTKTGRVDEYEIDALELAAFATTLTKLYTRVGDLKRRHSAGEVISTNEGGWCRYCESAPFCASKNALLIQLSGRGLTVLGDTTMTQAKAADAVREFQRAEQLVKDAKTRLTQYVDENGPIAMGDGKYYGRYVRQGDERLDGSIAVKAIREIVGESAKEFESVAIDRRVSKAALTRAARAIGQQPKLATKVVNRIRELGGSSHAAQERPVGEFTDLELSAPPVDLDVEALNSLLRDAG